MLTTVAACIAAVGAASKQDSTSAGERSQADVESGHTFPARTRGEFVKPHRGIAIPFPEGKAVAEILDRRPGVRHVTLNQVDQVSTPRGTGLHGCRWLPLGERAALSIPQ